MGGTPTDSTAVAPGRDAGEFEHRLSRSASGHTIFRLWIPGMDPARRAAEFCPDRNPGPNDLGRSGLQARHGARRRAQETVGPSLFCGSHCPVAPRGRAAGKMIVGDRWFRPAWPRHLRGDSTAGRIKLFVPANRMFHTQPDVTGTGYRTVTLRRA